MALDFTVTTPTSAIGAGTPSRAISITLTGSGTLAIDTPLTLTDGGVGGTFFPSAPIFTAAHTVGAVMQFVYTPPPETTDPVVITVVSSGGMVATHTITLPIAAPSVVASDSFTGTTGTTLASHTPDVGGSWTLQLALSGSTAALLGSGAIGGLGSSNASYFVPAAPSSLDYDVSATLGLVTDDSTFAYITGQSQGAGAITNYNLTGGSGSHVWVLGKSVNNVATTLFSVSSPPATYGAAYPALLAFRQINGHQYIFAFVDGALLNGAPTQDDDLTGGYGGITTFGVSTLSVGETISAFAVSNADWATTAPSYTLTGPAALLPGQVGTYTLKPNGSYTGTITLSGGGSGTLTPGSLSWSASPAAKTFTYSNASSTTVTLAGTASPSLGTDQTLAVTIRTATTFYIANSGSDSNAGTSQGSPWQTPAKVNSSAFVAGDSISFQGSQTFAGPLTLAYSGNASAPILVGTYGAGLATILTGNIDGTPTGGNAAGAGWAVRIYNAAYVRVSGLIVQGPGVTLSTGATTSSSTLGIGIDVRSDTSIGVRYPGLQIDSCQVTGTYEGIFIRSVPLVPGSNPDPFDGLRITNTVVHSVQDNGIITWGGNSTSVNALGWYRGWCHRNAYVADCQVFNLNGQGISLINVDGGTVERCVAHDGGALHGISTGDQGSAGILAGEARGVLIQESEAYNMTAPGRADGCGFDLDVGTVNCTIQRCYSHDNYGPGFQTGGIPDSGHQISGNAFRNNISVNDCRNPQTGLWGQGGIFAFEYAIDTVFAHNTVYMPGLTATNPPACIGYTRSNNAALTVQGNIFISQGNALLVGTLETTEQPFAFTNNLYWSTSGTPAWVPTGSTRYTSLAAFRSLGEGCEVQDGAAVGIYADPTLAAITTHPVLMPSAPASSYTGADPLSGSPAIGTANLSAYGFDFHGRLIPGNGLRDLGAVQFDAAMTGVISAAIPPLVASTYSQLW